MPSCKNDIIDVEYSMLSFETIHQWARKRKMKLRAIARSVDPGFKKFLPASSRKILQNLGETVRTHFGTKIPDDVSSRSSAAQPQKALSKMRFPKGFNTTSRRSHSDAHDAGTICQMSEVLLHERRFIESRLWLATILMTKN